jgi:hypothetical protein
MDSPTTTSESTPSILSTHTVTTTFTHRGTVLEHLYSAQACLIFTLREYPTLQFHFTRTSDAKHYRSQRAKLRIGHIVDLYAVLPLPDDTQMWSVQTVRAFTSVPVMLTIDVRLANGECQGFETKEYIIPLLQAIKRTLEENNGKTYNIGDILNAANEETPPVVTLCEQNDGGVKVSTSF